MPSEIIAGAPGPVVALCHHPLALETGIEPAARERLAASEREALGLAAAVITTSRTTAETLSTHFGVAPGKIAIALPGTDPASRARGSGGGTVALLSVGSLVPRKGHDVLLSALGRLKALDWRLEIVGTDDRDRRHADALKAQAVSLGISDRVTFTGAASEADLEQRYARADVFVLASHYEGFGMVYAEAIARGLPVIGTRAGAIAEATGGAAELVAPGDIDALASTLARVLASPSARHDLASRAEAAARTLPRWTDTVAAIVTALERLAVGGSERRCCGASR
jgi:glycosyltransferase involved in cell wall biosynthesis